MKTFLLLVLALTTAFVWQRSKDHASEPTTHPQQSPTQTVQATPRPTYEHDWAKHSLDRTHEVTDQVRKTRQENEQP